VSYVGELGWELYAPAETLRALYAALRAAADSLPEVTAAGGLRDVGYYAIEALRVERGYRALPADIAADTSPYEAGLGWAVRLGKAGAGDVVGHAALAAAARAPLTRRLVHFAFADPAVYAHGDEPIFVGGEPVGWTTSVAWAETAGACVGMGYVSLPPAARPPQGTADAKATAAAWGPFLSASEGEWEAEVFGVRHRLTRVGLRPLYDPAGERVRADGE
jgi:4-methylaminobutanoate oxidase (formaldehyde-forming)